MSRVGSLRALASAMLMTLSAMLAGATSSPAVAAPDDSPAMPEVALTWPALGMDREVLLGPGGNTHFTMPVPLGLTAQRVRGTVRAPTNIDGGSVEVDDGDGKFIALIAVPPLAANQFAVPFDIDISAASVRASSIDLNFILRPNGIPDKICGPRQSLTLSDLTTVFTGGESPPTTVATFFAPVLEQVAIYAPADADTAEQQTVLTLVSTLARIYHAEQLAITVVSHPRGAAPPPAQQRARAIVVERGDDAGFTVEDAGSPGVHLKIAGKGDELPRQVSLLGTELQSLAQSLAFRVDEAGSDAAVAGDAVTFGQLNMKGETVILRDGSLSVGVDRSGLGNGRVDSVQVHLLANHTPVAKGDAATMVIHANRVVVYQAVLDDTGVVDGTFTLDRRAFGQWVRLDFAFTYTPRQNCGPLISPITFQIDTRSTLAIRRGGPPLGGFGAFPSEFSPSFMVAFDGSDPNQLSYAARVVGSIARVTTSPLMPKVVDLKTAVEANSGALILASSAAIKQTSLDPPVGGDGTSVDFHLPSELRADSDGGLGSIQAFSDKPRNRAVVLVTTTAGWALVTPLFNYLDGLDGGWSQLSGDVLAAGPAGTPTILAIRTESSAALAAAPQAGGRRPWIKIGLGVGTLTLAAIAGAVIWRWRRRIRPD